MTTQPTTPPPATVRNHGGQPAGGKHVPSSAPGTGPVDTSAAVGSNITPMQTGPAAAASSQILDTPPWAAVNPNSAQWMPPID